jgi:hypothetical protein
MSRVQIACFVEEEHAQLAASFLKRHGVRASVPTMYFRWKVNYPHPVFVEQGQAEKATGLFRKVVAGEFADEDPLDNTGGGLGAALAEAVLPAPGFQRPTSLSLLAPFIVLAAGTIVLVFGPAAFRFLMSLWP